MGHKNGVLGQMEGAHTLLYGKPPVARELAPVGLRSSPILFNQKAGAASQPSGSKLPRHRGTRVFDANHPGSGSSNV